MSKKVNFSIDEKLLLSEKNSSGQVTHALKIASDHLDDFIKSTRGFLNDVTPMVDLPTTDNLLPNGALRYNLIIETHGVQLFISKGTAASLQKGVLTVRANSTVELPLNNSVNLEWCMVPNDYNSDELSVVIKVGGVC